MTSIFHFNSLLKNRLELSKVVCNMTKQNEDNIELREVESCSRESFVTGNTPWFIDYFELLVLATYITLKSK